MLRARLAGKQASKQARTQCTPPFRISHNQRPPHPTPLPLLFLCRSHQPQPQPQQARHQKRGSHDQDRQAEPKSDDDDHDEEGPFEAREDRAEEPESYEEAGGQHGWEDAEEVGEGGVLPEGLERGGDGGGCGGEGGGGLHGCGWFGRCEGEEGEGMVVCLFVGGWEGMVEKEVWIVGREGDEGGVQAERGLGRGYKSGRDKGNGTGDFRRGSLRVSKRDG